jgi:hypothetical protein
MAFIAYFVLATSLRVVHDSVWLKVPDVYDNEGYSLAEIVGVAALSRTSWGGATWNVKLLITVSRTAPW